MRTGEGEVFERGEGGKKGEGASGMGDIAKVNVDKHRWKRGF